MKKFTMIVIITIIFIFVINNYMKNNNVESSTKNTENNNINDVEFKEDENFLYEHERSHNPYGNEYNRRVFNDNQNIEIDTSNLFESDNIVVNKLNKNFGSKLKNTGVLFVKYANLYGIDAYLGASISMHETDNGSSPIIHTKNNPGGIMNSQGDGLVYFKSLELGIKRLFEILKTEYYDKGLNTIERIQPKYCPIGAKNDPTGLNKYWTSGVKYYYNLLRNN